MIQPIYLREGDQVWITAPARKMMLSELEPAIKLLTTWGFKVKIGSTIGTEYHQFSDTDERRVADMQAAINDEETKAIWCARGGYGTIRVIDQIDFSPLKKHPKWLMGYSDITVLHAQLHKQSIESIHSIMPVDVRQSDKTAVNSLLDVLKGRSVSYSFPVSEFNRKGEASGKLIGGNLSVIYSMLGSVTSYDTKGKILFLEDLDEYLYHIDRMLMNLKRNGYFDGLNGLIIGGMTKMHDNTIPFGKDTTEIINDIVKEYNFPVAFNFPGGHVKDNRALILGREAILTVDEKQSSLKF